MPCFSDCISVEYPYAKRLAKELVILPLHEYLTDENKDIMIEVANAL